MMFRNYLLLSSLLIIHNHFQLNRFQSNIITDCISFSKSQNIDLVFQNSLEHRHTVII